MVTVRDAIVALADTDLPDRLRLLAVAESAGSELAPEVRTAVLAGVARCDAPVELLARIESAADTLPSLRRAQVLLAVADAAGVDSTTRDRVLAAAESACGGDVTPTDRTRILLAICAAQRK